jgi:putative tributyrin esterase
MALAHLHVFAKTLQKQVAMSVLLPEGQGPGPFPTFYLLHGLSDDYTQWVRRTRIEMYVAGHPLIVVMPDGFRGFYTDHEQGPKYGTYLAEDVVEIVETYFPAIPDRSARAIGGLSMGGYGALRTALAYPEKFISANSHSGAVLAGTQRWDKPHDRLDSKELQAIFGKRPAGSQHDLLTLVTQTPKKKLPALRLDCGREDFLLNDNRAFAAELAKLRIPHTYEEHPGAHTWDYWDEHIRSALAFHAGHLGIT